MQLVHEKLMWEMRNVDDDDDEVKVDVEEEEEPSYINGICRQKNQVSPFFLVARKTSDGGIFAGNQTK